MRLAAAVVGATAVAAANFLLNLGTSSLFVDEVYSWGDASTPLGDLFDRLRDNEVTPPAYFAALHEWIGHLGADSDWAMRLPSALCAIALVPVLYYLGRRVAGEAAGVVAAFLGALSPLVLDYAQQVRGYAPAMLVCALAAACTLRAADPDRHATRWAAGAGVLAALAYAIHYTTAFATVPFVAWLLIRTSLPKWARVAAVVPLGLTALALLPLMLDQLETGRQAAISPFAGLTFDHALAVLGTPWDSRGVEPDLLRILGAAVTAPAIAWLLDRGDAAARVVGLAAAIPVAAAFVETLVSDDALITRYTSISAPFAIVAVGAACASLPRAPRAVALAAVAVVAVTGTIRGHGDEGRFADARGAVHRIAAEWHPGEPIVTPPNDVTVNLPVLYYAGKELPGATVVSSVPRTRPAWLVVRRAGPAANVVARFETSLPLVLVRLDR